MVMPEQIGNLLFSFPLKKMKLDLLSLFDLLSSSPVSPPFSSLFPIVLLKNRRYFRGDVGSYKLVEALEKLGASRRLKKKKRNSDPSEKKKKKKRAHFFPGVFVCFC